MSNDVDLPTVSPGGSTSTIPKRRKLMDGSHCRSSDALLPGLPDHISLLCLSLVHPLSLYAVCRSWRRLIYSPSFPPFLSLYALLSPPSSSSSRSSSTPLQTDQNCSDSVEFFSFDPISSNWLRLPPPPPDPPLRLVLHHPSFISRSLPVQSVSVAGNLVLVAATTDNFVPALPFPLVFNPLYKAWAFGPPLNPPRRWCAAGTVGGAVYVASGIGSQFSSDTARDVQKWDLHLQEEKAQNLRNLRWEWQTKSGLKDGRFSRDAIDAVGWRGKLCMVNVKGDAPKEGLVYDVEKDAWQEMPFGMRDGWRGPVAAMDEEVMYALHERKGALKKYDPERDEWEEIMESERLRGAQQMAAGGGKLCVVCGGGEGIVVVDVVSSMGSLRVVDLPTGFEAVAVHILPRMCLPEFGRPTTE